MEQRISLVTLGVADLPRAVDFCERVLGWKAASSPPGVVVFDLNGVVFALWPHDELAKDMGLTPDRVPDYRGYSLAHNVRSEAEVDAISARLKNHGVTIVKQPQKAFWGGYSGFFSDPDGTHLGDRLQPVLDHPSGRPRVDEEGLIKSPLSAACGSGNIVKIVGSDPADRGLPPER